MRIGFIGIGAIGTLFAAALALRHEVRALVRDEDLAMRVARRGGLVVDDAPPRPIRIGSDPVLFKDVDLVVVAVKTYDTTDALASIRGTIGAATPILSLQNGASHVDQIEAALGNRPAIVIAPTTEGATLVEPGIVRRLGKGRTRVGWAAQRDYGDMAPSFAAALATADLDAAFVKKIDAFVWEKIVVNAAINPLTALAGVPNGELLQQGDLWVRAVRAAREATAVAVSLGVVLPFADPARAVETIVRATAENRSSMLQDLERGPAPRRTEIDDITGAVVRYGSARGIEIEENARLLDEVHERMEA
jgi:2-dehydropantoate 2-reductase